jgi:Legume lectin domain
MRSGIRCSSFVLVLALLLFFGASLSAQQITFEDFSNTSYAMRYLQLNGSATLNQYNGNSVLRLTDGNPGDKKKPGNNNPEAATVYFQDTAHAQGLGKQPVAGGFTTWFEFQLHNPANCCTPGDGFAFIIQNNATTDASYGASGYGFRALGAGNGDLGGGMGYAGISNNLAVEFDVLQDPWDPNSDHIAVQTCGPNTNTPVHLPGDYTIGNNPDVTSCLYNNAIYTVPQNNPIGGTCGDGSCSDGIIHSAVIGYTPPSATQPGTLQIWYDPTYVKGTHTPMSPPAISVPYNIVYDAENNPLGLNLDPLNGGSAWVGFTASQPDDGWAQDILAWEFTNHSPTKIQQVIQPGGVPTTFAFGGHQTVVTYPQGFSNPNGTLMTVTATPTDRIQFYQTRLFGTQFANEQCIVYLGTGGTMNPVASGNCVVYSYTCQDQMGNQVTCPQELQCSPQQENQCINIDTSYSTSNQVTATNADYLENDGIGSNNWMSIFLSFMNKPIDGTTAGGSRGFGGGLQNLFRDYMPYPTNRTKFGVLTGADIVATFRPGQP